MTELTSISGGNWLKFDRYELLDGCIAPAPGAKYKVYDPWKLHQRPYEALANLVAARDVLQLPAEQPDLVAALIDWCKRYGLLGTLFHRVIAATTAAHWTRMEFADGKDHNLFFAEQRMHARVPGGWQTHATGYTSVYSADPGRLGAAVPQSELPNDAPQPNALVIDLPGVMGAGLPVRQEPLEKTWGEHFPNISLPERKTYAYPTPHSPEFWPLYGEPVHEFTTAAYLLVNALEAIEQPKHANAQKIGFQQLTELTLCSDPIMEQRRNGKLRQRWRAGSLLSSLALMAMEDLASERLHRCATCSRFFVSDAPRVAYCSPKCRHTMQKRRFREKHPDYERTARRRRLDQKES